MARRQPPVLIQRELLLDAGNKPDAARIEDVVSFQRKGFRMLLVAEQPVRWRPTRKAVDHDLMLQQELHQLIRRAGAELDGVLYLTTGLFARRRARLQQLEQLASRYDVDSADLVIISTEAILLESIIQTGGRAMAVGNVPVAGASRHDSLRAALDHVSRRG
jgi:hypothetical protein